MLRRSIYFLFLLFLLSYLSPSFLLALEQTTSFNQQWLKSVVSIERYNDKNKINPIGTGFLISSENNHMLLVSAKHVVTDDKGRVKNGLAYRINLQDEKSTVIEDKELIRMGGGNWFLSKSADLAVRFMPSSKKTDVLKIPQNLFLKEKNVQPGTPSLILGFPLGLRSEKYATPIVRSAVVALKRSDYFIIDGFAFPGNSGGPVLYMPTHQIGGIKLSNYINEQLLLGVVSSYIPYKDTAISLQTKRPRITFEENSGLTIVIPSDEILKLLNRHDIKELDKNLKMPNRVNEDSGTGLNN